MIRILILAALASGVLSQIAQNTACVAPAEFTIDPSKFLTTWYQIERIANDDETGDCSTITFALDKTTGSVTNMEVFNKTVISRKGVIDLAGSDFTKGKFKVTFEDQTTYEYHLLGSDNDNYAVLYTCKDGTDANNPSSKIWAWKISKGKNLTTESETAINTLFTEKYPVLSTATWRETKQDGCGINGSSSLLNSPILALTAFLFMFKNVMN